MNRISKSNKFDETLNASGLLESYNAITNDIAITVWPEFADSKRSGNGDLFIWAYHVRIENKKNVAVQLLKRYWRIIDENGEVQEVNGEGVIGQQPVIAPNTHYQYSSAVHLSSSSGIMSGKYFMKNLDDQQVFEVNIPTFSLDIPHAINVIN